MFLISMKGSSIKLVLTFVLSAIIIAVFVALLPGNTDADTAASTAVIREEDCENIKTNEDRVEFLKRFGWEVDPEANDVKDVTIPAEFDSVYKKYNDLQKADGLDLADYKNKTVTRYTYTVKNYDYDGTVYANILIYKDQVVGGDICSAAANGFIEGLGSRKTGNN